MFRNSSAVLRRPLYSSLYSYVFSDILPRLPTGATRLCVPTAAKRSSGMSLYAAIISGFIQMRRANVLPRLSTFPTPVTRVRRGFTAMSR